jgi:hypothetical protein
MFYSMMSESAANAAAAAANNNNSPSTNINLNRTISDDSGSLNNTTTGLDSSSSDDSSKLAANDLDTDGVQFKLRQRIRHAIDELKNDIIVVNNKSKSNLFQTFKVKFRMLTVTVLHTDPTTSSSSNVDRTASSSSTASGGASSKFLLKNTIVDRMKTIADNYFDHVSTIETTSSFGVSGGGGGGGGSSTNGLSIEKTVIAKYHQACAFNDHFLLLLKPISLNLVQKINQHNTLDQQHQPKYSLNDVHVSVGYFQCNEYLINERIVRLKQTSQLSSHSHR